MLIENFGTTRLSGEREDQCVTGRLLQNTIYNKKNRYVYGENSKHDTLPDRHKLTIVQRGTTLGFNRKLPS